MPTSQKKDDKGFIASFIKYLPIMQWVFTILIGIAVFALSQRDIQTTQAQTIHETKQRVASIESTIEKRTEARDKQIETMRKEILTREVFDAYHQADSLRMERMERTLQLILEK